MEIEPRFAHDLSATYLATVGIDIGRDLSFGVPPAQLDELGRHPDQSVRMSVACQVRTPEHTYARLARDPDRAVRYAAASALSLHPGQIGLFDEDRADLWVYGRASLFCVPVHETDPPLTRDDLALHHQLSDSTRSASDTVELLRTTPIFRTDTTAELHDVYCVARAGIHALLRDDCEAAIAAELVVATRAALDARASSKYGYVDAFDRYISLLPIIERRDTEWAHREVAEGLLEPNVRVGLWRHAAKHEEHMRLRAEARAP